MSRFPLTDREDGHEVHAQRGQFISCSVGQTRVSSVYVTLDAPPAQFEPFTIQFNKMKEHVGGGIICGDFNTFRNCNDSWRFQEALSRSEVGTDVAARGSKACLMPGGSTLCVSITKRDRFTHGGGVKRIFRKIGVRD